jgi:hypothetical protein
MKAGRSLESYVQFVYQKLLEFMEEGTLVSTNVSIVGKTGARHEFDVYYEFTHLNLKHAVAIECKDWRTPVTVGEVRDFCGKLEDLNRVSGMMVSRSGYQAGARQYARGKGIELLEEKDLPTFTSIVAGVIKNGFLPDKTVRGALLDTDGGTEGRGHRDLLCSAGRKAAGGAAFLFPDHGGKAAGEAARQGPF